MSKGVKKKGFTLVELVVVLAIFGLLASITGLGLYSWTRYSINKENNENARTIFLAAQESLTHMQASGTLKDFGKGIVLNGDNDSFGAIQKTPPAIASAANRPNSLYTIFYEPGTLNSDQSEVNTLIKETILPYLEGTGVFSHPFALEIDPVDGVVYSAFYSSKADSLYYEDEGDTNIINESGKVGIYYRTEGILKDRLLGFYHTELTAPKPIEIPAVNFATVEPEDTELLVNKDELYFRIPTTSSLVDKGKLKTDYSYKIVVYGIDNDKNKSIKAFDIKFDLNNISENGDVVCKATYYKNKGGASNQKDVDVKLKIEIRDEDIKVILDAIDINTLNVLYNNKINYEIKTNNVYISNISNNFDNTYSIFNLLKGMDVVGNKGDLFFSDIYCEGYINEGTKEIYKTDPSQSNVKNMFFKDLTVKNNGLEATISNIRHLFNTCYFETMNKKNAIPIEYNQDSNIDFNNTPIYSSVNGSRGLSLLKVFPSLPQLSSNSVLEGKNNITGEQYSIDNIILDSKIFDDYVGYSEENKKSLGIFQNNKGTINNVLVSNISVYSNVESTDSTIDRKDMAFGSGGIAGINNGTIKECEIDSGFLDGYVNLGGIAGINYGKIEDSKSNVEFKPKTKESYNFGGIVGLNKNNTAIISNCEYTTSNYLNLEMLESDIFKDNLKGFHIGGIVGKNATSATVQDCITTSKNNGYIIGYGSVGGIIGICDSTSHQDGAYSNVIYETYNEANVIGVDCVGGIVANYAVGNDNKVTLKDWENRGAIVVYKNGDNPGKYGGGITSYLLKEAKIENCRSYVNFDADNYESDVKYNLVKKYSKGDYVGGLIGELRGSIISNSVISNVVLVGGGDHVGGLIGSPAEELKGKDNVEIKNQQIFDGIITGDNYVGGLSGTTQQKIDFKNDNYIAHYFTLVEGKDYVGGLTGYHQKGDLNNNTISYAYIAVNGQYGGGIAGRIEETLEANDLTTLESITIKGGSYIGGLVGYNDNKIINKYTVDNVTINSPSGNNIGGLIGYNSGTLTSEGLCQTTANVAGKSVVGGLVGENTGTIVKRQLNNSIIAGNGDYIGGIAGVNSGDLDNKDTANHIIVSVTGKSYVGGLVGKNTGDVKNHGLSTSVVYADGNYVGGIAGYNSRDIKRDQDTAVKVTVNNIFVDSKYTGGIIGQNTNKANIEKYYVSEGSVISLGSFVGGIAGDNKGNINTGNKNNSETITVSGKSYVGGIVGNNDGDLEKISFNNFVINGEGDYVGGVAGYNSKKISASENKAITVYVQNKHDKSEYTGGVVGKNAKTSNIEKFYVTQGTVLSLGSYVGGVSGENLGSIKTDKYVDSTTSINVSGVNFIGGISGNNEGEFENIYFKRYAITGTGNRVGGLFGFNKWKYSLDQDTEMIFNVNGKDFTGGLVGYNDSGSEIKKAVLSAESKIIGADNVGWLCGYNAGNIHADNNTDYKVNVTGNSNVGGLIGVCAGGKLEKQTIKTGEINAAGDFVGGVFGVYDSNSVTDYEITIDNLTIKGNTYIGGIFGKYNTAQNITIKAKINGLTVEGTDFVGGIVPVLDNNVVLDYNNNYGTFDKVNLIVKNGTGGIVTAVNKTNISGLKLNNCILTVNGNSSVGGVSGINKGTIGNVTVNSLLIKYSSDRNIDAGAIAGINHGTISNSIIYDTNFEQLPHTLEETENNSLSLNIGQISGINGNIDDLYVQASINNCKVFDIISNDEIVKEISGINLYKINNCTLVADVDKNKVDAAKALNQIKNTPTVSDLNVTDNSISFKFTPDTDYSIGLYGLLIKDSTYIEKQIDYVMSSISCENYSCSFIYSDNEEKYDGYRVVLENKNDINNNKLPSLIDEVYLYEVNLNTLNPIVIEDESGNYTLKWSVDENQSKYIDSFIVYAQINSINEVRLMEVDKEIRQTDITIQKNLNDVTGNYIVVKEGDSIRFAIVANSNDTSTIYTNSAIKYSQEYNVKTIIDNTIEEETYNNYSEVEVLNENIIPEEGGEE